MNRIYTMLLLCTGAFFSCKKQNANIIIDGQGNSRQLEAMRSDTFTLQATTIREDSLPGNNLRYNLLGSMNDPQLGPVRASLYAEIGMLEPNNNFPNTVMPDSAVLYIPVVDGLNFYGDRNTPQGLHVYKLSSTIDPAGVYYQHKALNADKSLSSYYYGKLFSGVYDSVGYGKGKLELHPGLRVKLSADFAKYLMQLPIDAYQTNENLKKYFRGIALLPEQRDYAPGQGGLAVMDANNVVSLGYRAKIMLYYNDTSTFVFTFDGSKAAVTYGETGPYPAAINAQLTAPAGSSFGTTWVQALSGLKTHVRIPHLLNLVNNGNVAINKAQIVFHVDKSVSTANLFAPPRLNLFQPAGINSRRNYLLDDATLSSFGGTYNESAGTYTFTITHHLQNILNKKVFEGVEQNLGLYLAVPADQPVIGARAAIDHSKTKLIITYTKPN
ncbi:MAG: DUF4270 family protein [Bacteroidetes bacterium]|nr:DUF4270 family protein [Bacteroidota bacterium]